MLKENKDSKGEVGCSSMSCTWSSAPGGPKARWTRRTSSSRCSRAASCTSSARRPSTNIGSTSRRMRLSSGASSPSTSASRTSRTRSLFSAGSRSATKLHHGVRIKDSALVAAAVLSNRYISDRFLPDKAIDLIDEAASRLGMEMDFDARRAR